MKTEEILGRVVDVHNRLALIYVKGEDAIAMGNVLVNLRGLASELQHSLVDDAGTQRE